MQRAVPKRHDQADEANHREPTAGKLRQLMNQQMAEVAFQLVRDLPQLDMIRHLNLDFILTVHRCVAWLVSPLECVPGEGVCLRVQGQAGRAEQVAAQLRVPHQPGRHHEQKPKQRHRHRPAPMPAHKPAEINQHRQDHPGKAVTGQPAQASQRAGPKRHPDKPAATERHTVIPLLLQPHERPGQSQKQNQQQHRRKTGSAELPVKFRP